MLFYNYTDFRYKYIYFCHIAEAVSLVLAPLARGEFFIHQFMLHICADLFFQMSISCHDILYRGKEINSGDSDENYSPTLTILTQS